MDLFLSRSLPFMSRRNYVCEARHLLLWGVVAGMAEGSVTGVVVSKTFGGSELLIGFAAASPMCAKLVSLLWGMVCVGRRKLPVISLLALATVVCLLSVAATPDKGWGGALFVTQLAMTQIFLSGVVTVRTALWKHNYPKEYRGRITSRLQVIRLIPSIATMFCAAAVFDRDPSTYCYIYPLVALCGAAGIILLQRMQVRGEKAQMRRLEDEANNGLSEGLAEPFSLAAILWPGNVLGEMKRVLWEDKRFARYCGALMLIGMGNLMVVPVMVIIVTQALDMTYMASLALLEIVPRGVMMLALYRWAPYFDRVGVVRFRVANGACWLTCLVLGTLGAAAVVHSDRLGPSSAAIAVALFALCHVFKGLGFGSGALAWNLGHLHFARPHEAEVYMGIHVTLTGLRGLIMPLLGIWLWSRTGILVWVLACVLCAGGLLGYISMARAERAAGR